MSRKNSSQAWRKKYAVITFVYQSQLPLRSWHKISKRADLNLKGEFCCCLLRFRDHNCPLAILYAWSSSSLLFDFCGSTRCFGGRCTRTSSSRVTWWRLRRVKRVASSSKIFAKISPKTAAYYSSGKGENELAIAWPACSTWLQSSSFLGTHVHGESFYPLDSSISGSFLIIVLSFFPRRLLVSW